MTLTVTGIIRGKNKDGKEFAIIHGTTPFSNYESENNDCVGLKTSNVYTYLDCKNIVVGDVCELYYEPGFQGQATLSKIEVVKPAKTTIPGKV